MCPLRIGLILSLAAGVLLAEEELPPVLEQYCLRCHGGEKVEGEFDLRALSYTADIWRHAKNLVDLEEMPTKGPQPTAEERRQIMDWIGRHAAIAPEKTVEYPEFARLTHEQYGNTLRDLLGVDFRAGELLGPDSQGVSGFTNDRVSLSMTPAQIEKYFNAAERSVAALLALKKEPATHHFEAEAMRASTSRLPDFKDGRLFISESQIISESIEVPADGYYEITFHGGSLGNRSVAQILLGTEVIGSVEITNQPSEPRDHTLTVFLRKGYPELSFNTRNLVPQAKLPRDANYVFNQRAEENALRVPELPDDASEELVEARETLVAKVEALQQAYEWLRALGVDGDSRDIDRFRRYANERAVGTEKVRVWYGTEVLGLDRETWDRQWQKLNADRIADNQHLLDRVAHVEWEDFLEHQGKLYIDWIQVRGPTLPEGAEDRVFNAGQDPETTLTDFLPRAFRRPVDPAEMKRYHAMYDLAQERGLDSEDAIITALASVLTSPHFLYKSSPAWRDQNSDPYALASNLSYFLWQTMPDAELFDLAASGILQKDEIFRNQIRRMIADPRFEESMASFVGQWLGTGALGETLKPDEFQFPEFTSEIQAAARAEPVQLFTALVRENRPIHELLSTNETWVNEILARYYGIEGVEGREFQRVALNDPRRGGLLGMAGPLAATSTPVRTSPVVRGKWVWENLLGEEIGDPLPDAGILPATAGAERGLTMREEIELHSDEPRCARCHKKLDPIGFGLENFNAIGQWRDSMAGKPIDARGSLDGWGDFEGPAELKQLLLEQKDEFLRQIASRMLSFALGRSLDPSDDAAIDKIVQSVKENGYSAGTLVEEVAMRL